MDKTIIICATALLGLAAFAQGRQGTGRRMRENPDAKLHRFSTTVEKERPQLNDETKRLIAAYHRNPTDENRAALRKQCAINYDNIVKRKKAKLEELKRTARHQSKVDEMQEIVDEMIANREHRIDQTMARFTDSRFRGRARRPATADYLPLLGAAKNVSVAYAPVTNEDFAKFTGKPVPAGTEKYPRNQYIRRRRCEILQVAWGARSGAHLPTPDRRGMGAGGWPHAKGCRLQLWHWRRNPPRGCVRADERRIRRHRLLGQLLGVDGNQAR